MVARPWQPVEHRSPSPSRGSDGHCWVTFGKNGDRYGVVTAAHVIAPEGAATGSKVSANITRAGTSGSLRERSVIMDAALIDMSDHPRPDLISAPHSKVPGYKPIRLCTGREPVDGLVLELFGFIGGEFTRNPDGEPELRALMAFNVAGQAGDSGCLVLDREFERGGTVAPYLMYMGVIQLADRQAGRGLFLDQVAYHWQVDFQFSIPPLGPAAASVRGKASGQRLRFPTKTACQRFGRPRNGSGQTLWFAGNTLRRLLTMASESSDDEPAARRRPARPLDFRPVGDALLIQLPHSRRRERRSWPARPDRTVDGQEHRGGQGQLAAGRRADATADSERGKPGRQLRTQRNRIQARLHRSRTVVFIAQAGIEATISATFKRREGSAGKPDDPGQARQPT